MATSVDISVADSDFLLVYGVTKIIRTQTTVSKQGDKFTAPGLATSSFSEQGDSSLMDTLLASLAAGAVGVDDVGVVGKRGGD